MWLDPHRVAPFPLSAGEFGGRLPLPPPSLARCSPVLQFARVLNALRRHASLVVIFLIAVTAGLATLQLRGAEAFMAALWHAWDLFLFIVPSLVAGLLLADVVARGGEWAGRSVAGALGRLAPEEARLGAGALVRGALRHDVPRLPAEEQAALLRGPVAAWLAGLTPHAAACRASAAAQQGL